MVNFEAIDPADFASALGSLPISQRVDCIQDPIGTGHDVYLQWALADIEQAEDTPGSDQSRFCVNAVMNARRSLSCLADQYLHREGITYCRDAPRDAKKISEILVARKIFTERSAACLQRAIELRNQAEHKYRAISLQEAQDVVHLVHMTVEFTVKGSSPFYAVGGYGLIDGGVGSGKNGIYANFRGWGTCRIVAVPFVERPWIGVVLPGSTDVVIRRVFLDQFKVADYMNVLKILDDETQFPRAGVSSSANLWDALYKKAGLLP